MDGIVKGQIRYTDGLYSEAIVVKSVFKDTVRAVNQMGYVDVWDRGDMWEYTTVISNEYVGDFNAAIKSDLFKKYPIKCNL